ncbi:MAG: N-acetylmuramoyl-L-alanine amidase [Paludibacteraceae bacterium]|nr:N-acetylmuramoyl-L-alanine amidase [Paludibacteraceae bacterium]
MRAKFVFLIFACFAISSLAMGQQGVAKHAFTVVIDAGHGGKDPGAVGTYTYEKNLNLAVALETGKMIREAYPEVNVVFTRDSDVFLPLQARADTVNKRNADLFICIHTNSSDSRQACGAETYILGTDKMEQNLDVAMRENAVIKLESDYETAYQGFDPNSIDSYIMFELMQNQYIDQSLQFASLVQQRFLEKLPLADRGVRQAAYWVLLKSACPSVLIEMGFISNPKEERFLASAEGQHEVAQVLYESFCSFYHKPAQPTVKPAVQPQPEQKPEPKVEPKTESKPASKVEPKQPAAQPVAQPAAKPTVQPQPEQKSEQKQEPTPEPKPEPKVESQAPATDVSDVPAKPALDWSQPVYAVQVMALRAPIADKDRGDLKGYDCKYFVKDNYYKYYTGATNNREEALRTLETLKSVFQGCFLTTVPAENK